MSAERPSQQRAIAAHDDARARSYDVSAMHRVPAGLAALHLEGHGEHELHGDRVLVCVLRRRH